MCQSRRAFTLIELLVVIAIIAILAAILFPVFAQAKAAAKQSVCLSNTKQMNLAIVQYGGDNDDLYPAGEPNALGGWNLGYAGWDWPCDSVGQAQSDCLVWGNSTYSYVKSRGIFSCPSVPVSNEPYHYGNDRTPDSFTFNGTLQFSSSTSVASPGVTVALWSGFMANGVKGRTWGNPCLRCDDANQACVYVPNSTKSYTTNGSEDDVRLDGRFYNNSSHYIKWAHGRGDNFGYVDGHAKWRPLTGSIQTDPWTYTGPNGETGPSSSNYGSFWSVNSHTCLFSPDNPCGL